MGADWVTAVIAAAGALGAVVGFVAHLLVRITRTEDRMRRVERVLSINDE